MLHKIIKERASNGVLRIEALKPNSKEVALRLISEGKLIKKGVGYIWHEVKR